jgi:hypothetical protein
MRFETRDRDFYYYLLNVEDYNLIISESLDKLSTQFFIAESSLLKKSIITEHDIFIDNNIKNNRLNIELKLLNDKINSNINLYHTYIIKQFSPLLRIDGCWLNGLVSLKDSLYKYGGILLQSHAMMVGNGKINESNSFVFEQYAGLYKINFLPIFSKAYIEDLKIEEFAFKLPVFLLSIAQFPSRFAPEILGVNLFMSIANNLIPLDRNNYNTFYDHKNNVTQTLIDNAYAALKEYIIEKDPIEIITFKSRVINGYVTCYSLFKSFLISLHQAIEEM